jgi:16S rRNA (cytidine1402-2'-O)-methyltransferase
MPSVWYESPQRIRGLLADISAVDPAARVFLVREYTKRYEQQIAGTADEVAAQLIDPVRGEIALVVEPAAAPATPQAGETQLDDEIDALLREGKSVSAVAKMLAERGLGERRHIYARATGRKRLRRDESPAPR